MDQKKDKRFHLSILYVDDGGAWCEFLCDQFRSAYDLDLFWENITDLPLAENAASNVRNSKAQMIIVTPGYIDVSDPSINDILDTPIAFMCGIEENSEEAAELQRKVESFKWWDVVLATNSMRDIISQTFRIIDGISDPEDLPPNYVTIDDEEEVDSGTEGQGFYMVVKKESPISRQPSDLRKHLEKHGMVVRPNKAVCGVPETLIIVFKAALLTDQSSRYIVKFQGARDIDVDGVRLNDYVLSVTVPPDQPPCEAVISVSKSDSLSSLGECKFEFQDSLDVMAGILETSVNPKELLCQALKISPGDIRSLDAVLADSYKKQTSVSDWNKLTALKHEIAAVGKTRETPTLIHFAAKFGLHELASLLLNSPGALMAFEIVNCNGDYPNDIARSEGHIALADFLENFVECGALLEDINTGIMLYREVYDQIPPIADDSEQATEELYLDMKPSFPYYNTSHQFRDLQEGLYNTPFSIAIPSDPSQALFNFDHDDPIYTIENEKLKEVIQEGNLDSIYDDLPCPRKAKSSQGDMGYHPRYDDDQLYQNPDEVPLPFTPTPITRRPPTIPRPQRQRPGSLADDPAESTEDPAASEEQLPSNTAQAAAYPPSNMMPGLSVAQMELINIQRQVKEGKLTIDEAVKLFDAFKLDKLGKKENFYSYQTQTEFIYATKTSLKEKKKEIEMSLDRPLPPPPSDETTGKASWNELHRKMTCRPGKQREPMKRAPHKATPQSVEDSGRPFIRSDRLSTGSTASSISSRHSRGSSIRSVDSSYSSYCEDDQAKDQGAQQAKEPPQAQHAQRRRRRKKAADQRTATPPEHRLSQHIDFSEQYLHASMPPLPPRTHLDPQVRDPPPPPPPGDSEVPYREPPPPPGGNHVPQREPPPPPGHQGDLPSREPPAPPPHVPAYRADNPLPAPPEEDMGDEYSLQHAPTTTHSEETQRQPPKRQPHGVGPNLFVGLIQAELKAKLTQPAAQPEVPPVEVAPPVEPQQPGETYDDVEATKPANVQPRPRAVKPKPQPRPRAQARYKTTQLPP